MSSKLRETLLRCDAIAQLPEIREYTIVKEMRNLIKGALAEPLRNCEVGTADEQMERFRAFCYEYPLMCEMCPLKNIGSIHNDCAIHWMWMPYEKEVE